jgi:hypothetical protein
MTEALRRQHNMQFLMLIRLLPMKYFISLFSRIPCYQKCFETINEITHKIHDFILEFHNTVLYVVPLVIYGMK